MAASLKLISLNVERSKHLDRVCAFLAEERPDVLCLQEVLERDVPALEQASGPCQIYRPSTRIEYEGAVVAIGEAIFSPLPVKDSAVRYYWGDETLRDLDTQTPETRRATESRAVSFVTVEKDGIPFRIATTHFLPTPHGDANAYQRQDVAALLAELKSLGELVLTGDFNAPRGRDIFTTLANAYRDNIPAQYETSIDVSLHRCRDDAQAAAELSRVMVDGLFTTPAFEASEVRLVFGVSDHAAVVGSIRRLGAFSDAVQ